MGNPTLGRERRPLYRLATSDVLEASFQFAPEFNQTITIQPDGFITLRDAGHLVAEGKTIAELEQAITEAYGKILHEPHVTVAVREFEHPYFVASGEVVRPGKYELRGNKTITEALAIAGGFHSAIGAFSGGAVPALREDTSLRPGDYIYVPRSVISKIMRFMPATNMGMYTTSTNF
jgi:protein involved in polysaccharide export with SLBB domain